MSNMNNKKIKPFGILIASLAVVLVANGIFTASLGTVMLCFAAGALIAGIICTCFQVTENVIWDAIKQNGLKTVEEVTNYTKAGGACAHTIGQTGTCCYASGRARKSG